uniref:Protein tweety homolog n=1 Tax=Lepeophtheirus salmonis TaxID=72036 RepID=A0A0K2V9Q3_LEPSM
MSLIESSSQVQTAYEPTIWAKVFHSVPHVNITGHEVDGRFNPESDVYLESLGILGSLPAGWLIGTLLLLLMYLLTRCCDRTKGIRSALDGKKRKSRPIRCCLSFFALGCCTTLTLGFFGNHLLHKGVIELEKATKNINTIISHSQEIAHKYLLVLTDDLNDNLSHLFDGPFRKSTPQSKNEHSNLMNNADLVFYNISEAQKAMKQIQFAIHHHENPIDFKYATRWPRILEVYRWPATMALQGLFTLFCLLLFVGAIIHSRCILILFSVLGLFSIILLWLLSSVYITISVATADFCYEPTPWVMHAIEDKVPREISAYYLQCSNDQIHPFQHLIVIIYTQAYLF